MLRDLIRSIRASARRRDRGAEIDAEIASHLRMAIEDRIERGETPEQARRNAHVEFGSVPRVREEARAVWSWTAIEQLLQDARTGTRILTSSPGLSATAVALIALVIGGNTTIYSAVHGMLTKPAPALRADGLVSIGWIGERDLVRPDITYERFRHLASSSRTLDLLAFRVEQFTMTHDNGTTAVRGASVTPNYFGTLGLQLVAGRAFSDAESRLEGTGLVAIVSETVWRNHFQGTADVVGRSIALNGYPATIVGVAPPLFQGVWTAEATDVWVPLVALARISGRERELNDPAETAVHGVTGRLTPGASLAEARAEMSALDVRLPRPLSASGNRQTLVLLPYTGTAARDNLIAERGPRFLAIFSVVTALTLVIVCANVANLMLARAVVRQREMAVRQSFGASRVRIIRIIAAEGLTLSLVAWVLAMLFAYWMSQVLPGLIPESENGHAPLMLDFTPDWRVLGYAIVLAIAATAVFTFAPAVRTWRQDLLVFLKAGEQGVVQGRSRISHALVVLQVAFSVLLLTTAGLAYRSLSIIDARNLGFDPRDVLLLAIDTTGTAKTPAAHRALLDEIRGRLQAVPGLDAVSYTRHPPSQSWPEVAVRSSADQPPVRAERNAVDADYLRLLGVALLSGRGFTSGRGDRGIEAIVNQQLAQSLWPDRSPIGLKILVGDTQLPAIVVGVTPNVLFSGSRRQAQPSFVLLSPQSDELGMGVATLYVRHRSRLEAVVPAVTRTLRHAAPNVPALYVRTMERHLDEMTWVVRTLTRLLTLFAAGSLLIAALGQYAAMAFSMRRRVRDFGIRIALGASSQQVLSSALREGIGLTMFGLIIGVALGAAAGRSARSLLYGVAPTDAPTYAGVVVVLGCASLLACYLPARFAARVDPIRALRQE